METEFEARLHNAILRTDLCGFHKTATALRAIMDDLIVERTDVQGSTFQVTSTTAHRLRLAGGRRACN